MKFKTTELKNALRECGKVIKPRATVPQLSCVQFSPHKGQVAIRASNGVTWVTRYLDAEGEAQGGCLNHGILTKLLDATNAEECEIDFASADKATLKTHARLPLPALEAGAFPEAPALESKAVGIVCADFAEGLERTWWAAETNEAMPMRTQNVYLKASEKQMSVYAGTGKVIARFQRLLMGEAIELGIRAELVNYITPVLREPESMLLRGGNVLTVTSKCGSVSIPLATEAPPDYEQVLKEAAPGDVIDRDVLVLGCMNAKAITDDQNYPRLAMTWELNTLTLRSKGRDGSSYEHEVEQMGNQGWFACNADILREVLKNLPDGPVKLKIEEFKPSFWTSGDMLIALACLGTRRDP